MVLFIDGIEILVIKKRIKRFRLSVKKEDGSVRLSVPLFSTKAEILRELDGLSDWLKKTRNKILFDIEERKRRSGNATILFGEPYETEYVVSDRVGAIKTERKITIFTKTGGKEEIEKAVDSLYGKELSDYLRKRLPELEKETGLRSSSFSVNGAKTRWGSCNYITKKLNFSLRLAKKRPRLIDSVIVHELCHTVVPNHKKEFYELIEGFLPDYRQLKKELERD